MFREQLRNLLENIFDAALLFLIGMEDLQERLVGLRLMCESLLNCSNLVVQNYAKLPGKVKSSLVA